MLATNYATISDTCRLKRNKMPQLFQQHVGRGILATGYATHATRRVRIPSTCVCARIAPASYFFIFSQILNCPSTDLIITKKPL
jgi:hypothetical protein